MEELVSIIMPLYNCEKYVSGAIDSIINQSYSDWELIIVDDNSSDKSREVVKEFTDNRIKLLENQGNQGAAISRNRALREAKGRWIAFLDADDLWLDQKLEKQIHFMLENGYAFTYTNYQEMDSNGYIFNKTITGPKRITKSGMYKYCWPGCLTVMYDRNLVGDFQIVDIKKNNDYAMWLYICKKFDCYLLDETLAIYRRGRTGSISTESIIKMIAWHYKLFRIADNNGTIKSLIYTAQNLVFGLAKKIIYVR